MLPERVTGIMGWSVDRRYDIHDGAEKIVYPVRKEGMLYAAKIYRLKNASSYDQIDREASSRKEFRAYTVTSQSGMARYIPPPVEMIQDASGKDVGLLVTWKDGDVLADIYKQCLDRELIEEMRGILLGLPKPLWLDADSLSEANVGWDGSGLWLAEPKISTYKNSGYWKDMVNHQMDLLVESYVYQ